MLKKKKKSLCSFRSKSAFLCLERTGVWLVKRALAQRVFFSGWWFCLLSDAPLGLHIWVWEGLRSIWKADKRTKAGGFPAPISGLTWFHIGPKPKQQEKEGKLDLLFYIQIYKPLCPSLHNTKFRGKKTNKTKSQTIPGKWIRIRRTVTALCCLGSLFLQGRRGLAGPLC